MKAYKVELVIIDFDKLGPEGILDTLEETRYANDCIYPKVVNIESADIGEWTDEHPLNNSNSMLREYNRLFKENA